MARLASLVLAALLFLALPARAGEVSSAAPEEEQQQAIRTVLHQLYDAYKAKDLDTVMGLIHDAVESSARDYQERHPDKAGADQAIREAFLAFHQDIFGHQDFQILDFQDGFADFVARPDGSVEVTSSVPIISSEAMTFTSDDGESATVRLRLGRFVLRPDGKGWRIVEMNLF